MPTLTDAALFILLLLVAMHMLRIWKAVQWILKHVHVVPNRDANDPELTRIKQLFDIEPTEKGDGK